MEGVASDAGRLVATRAEPWLTVDGPDFASLAGRFVEIVYRASFWDEPARPVFRFRMHDGGHVDRIAAGPIAGAGIWIGRVPSGARRLDVSPTNRAGIFGFRIERIRPLPWLAVVALGLRRQPRRVRSALLTRFIGWRAESDANLAWAAGALPLANFETWRAERSRAPDLPSPDLGSTKPNDFPSPLWGGTRGGGSHRLADRDQTTTNRTRGEPPSLSLPHMREGDALDRRVAKREKDREHLDAPRFDWSAMSPIRVLIGDGDPAAGQRTLASLAAQNFANWTIKADEPPILADSLTCWVGPGDILSPIALAYAAEQAHRHPICRVFYADAIRVEGGRVTPSFQPAWSPHLHAARPLGDTLIFVRDLQTWPNEAQQLFRREGQVSPSVLSRLAASEVRPLRRLLIEIARARPAPVSIRMPVSSMPVRTSVIIPTCDHPALLRRCVASVRMHAGISRPQIVIVDNGSVTEPAKRLLAELARAPDTIVLTHPPPFNFSAMCNVAVAAATGDILVFLNDDTEVLTSDWLDRLATRAADPSIGAVGARLVFPDGRLQHVGIVVGLGESAGHFGAFAEASDPGWADPNTTPHEVSAVTGACLAVERAKFWAVGGFDEKDLPVELGDVDLCLKLNERGWQTVVDPGVTILHEESASRGGATFRRLDVYARQRAVFVERWRHVLRDDPYFHPGLSLYSFAPALA